MRTLWIWDEPDNNLRLSTRNDVYTCILLFFFNFQKIVEECCVCKQPIKGDCIESGKKAYHPGCLKCFVCNEILRGSYFFFEDQPICEEDYKVKISLNYSIQRHLLTCYRPLFSAEYICVKYFLSILQKNLSPEKTEAN